MSDQDEINAYPKRVPGRHAAETKCSTCEAAIVFLRTTRQGRRGWMPVDADTVKPEDSEFDRSRHRSHFATCEQAREHRRGR